MGVPAFFRWLSRRYHSIIVDAVEERTRDSDGTPTNKVDATQPNQNYQEFDNLYLDMNGIIHPCTHPEHRPAPTTEEEMFVLIFEYIDRLFSIVRPRRVLYMAIDGVAPRAKMNQQRSRRFRAAKESADKKKQIEEVRRKLQEEGVPLPPPRKAEQEFDSNCITPGTPFMARLSIALRYYIHKRITTDPAWQSIQVILSDANAPGEGEHKIMDYIRRQRASPSHDPNTVHCLCGADADLIMLGLATHEVNFNIIREEFVPNQPKPCELCGQYGHELENCMGLARKETGPDQADPLKKDKNFIFIRLPILREYLEQELTMTNLPFPFDLERAIDDWVFMCFFVGNDFLPHLPSLEIREGAIDRLVKLYKEMVYKAKGWLTKDGDVIIERVKVIMRELGKVEDEIFKTRQLKELRQKEANKQRRRRIRESSSSSFSFDSSLMASTPSNSTPSSYTGSETRKLAAQDRKKFYEENEKQKLEAASNRLRAILLPAGIKRSANDSDSDAPKTKDNQGRSNSQFSTESHIPSLLQNNNESTETSNDMDFKQNESDKKITAPLILSGQFNKADEDSDSEKEQDDGVRLWEAGWKDRYYQAKFEVSENDIEFRRNVACSYVEGLCWVLRYYYQGCASWTWYFPYHYAPFASDFDLIGDFEPNFQQDTEPFKPLEQLMGVFPAASRAHIPESWRYLMTAENSPIIDFYPSDFQIDLNGKKFAWQGVALLPFVDEKRLLTALKEVYHHLTPEEEARNVRGSDRLFVGKNHNLFDMINELVETKDAERDAPDQTDTDELTVKDGSESLKNEWMYVDPELSFGMAGKVKLDQSCVKYGAYYSSQFKGSLEFGDIKENQCLMVEFKDPQFDATYKFEAKRLEGVKELPRILKPREERDNGKPYRPYIGFSRDIPQASLSNAGHRMLNSAITYNRSRMSHESLHQQRQSLPWHSAPNYKESQPQILASRGPQDYRSQSYHQNNAPYHERNRDRNRLQSQSHPQRSYYSSEHESSWGQHTPTPLYMMPDRGVQLAPGQRQYGCHYGQPPSYASPLRPPFLPSQVEMHLMPPPPAPLLPFSQMAAGAPPPQPLSGSYRPRDKHILNIRPPPQPR